MAQNYILLERIELNASAASVTFSNIPQSGYTDLKIVSSVRDNESFTAMQFNGDTGANYSARFIRGNGTNAASNTSTNAIAGVANSTTTANTFSSSECYIPNYLGSTQKSISTDFASEANATAGYLGLAASLWTGTAAISSIRLFSASALTFEANSTFSLYGLAAVGTTPVIAPKASGGNIDYDGTYFIHTFLATDTFIPFTNLTCDYLVVAGGGGGGGYGGGGAGGLLEASSLSFTATNYTVTVGAGGAGGAAAGGVFGGTGTSSVFNSSTALGGGGGAAGGTGAAGGSGGGGGPVSISVDGAGGAATQGNSGGATGYGFAGGNAKWDPQYPGGGGGGAGAVGTTGTSAGGLPNGGVGRASSITGTSTTYAGGGGGGAVSNAGAGGAGGGGNGFKSAATSVAGTTGTINTGGGGGGGRDSTGYAGGSGIVIVRYLAA
jgi:hypothetical protein